MVRDHLNDLISWGDVREQLIAYVSTTFARKRHMHSIVAKDVDQILQTDFPTDHLSVSANQILRMDLPTEHLSISANQIPTEHLPYRPIISFGVSSAEIPKISSHSNGHEPHE